jgi:hypothetical protein
MILDITHDKLPIVGKLYFQLLIQRNRDFFFLNSPLSRLLRRRGLFNKVESPSNLYENCQRMRIEAVYTKTRIQLKIIILDKFTNQD